MRFAVRYVGSLSSSLYVSFFVFYFLVRITSAVPTPEDTSRSGHPTGPSISYSGTAKRQVSELDPPLGLASAPASSVTAPLASTFSSSTVAAALKEPCTAYELITCRGTNEPQVAPVRSQKWIAGVTGAVPRGADYEAVYPATFLSITTGPATAAADMLARMTKRQAACPGQKYMLFGYSQGAMAVVTLLNDASLNPDPIAGVVLYGNPYWSAATAGATNAGSATTGSGTFGGQKTVPPKFVARTKDYCNANDLFCAGGTSIPVHLGYPDSPQGPESIAFAVSQLRLALRTR